MRTRSRAVKALTLTALPLALALTACGSGSSGSADAAAKPHASAPASKDPNAGLLTGTQLKKVLAPASLFPAGFAPVPQGASDSGGRFVTPSDASTAKPDCTKLETTAWMTVTGGTGGASFANDDYVDKGKTAEIAQEVDEFPGATAAAAMKDVRAVTATCPTFTDTDAHATVKVSGRSTPGLGDEAYTITLTSGAWDNGTTLVAAREGTAVATVMSTAGSDNGAATAEKIARRIVESLKKTAKNPA
ncbi:hypothetical protein [Streptomyces sp. Ru72]|uniref:hypothetical protein n=1 Tax=Streptomyces sp. Ru72 TaxID=2080747 RepID=UPI000CDD1CF5|nr:hypothetical protein [Streptomyces sp. Ru72]POX54338.1 hypothetical protein C3488_02500 [Streptomyces sp. Ru72]